MRLRAKGWGAEAPIEGVTGESNFEEPFFAEPEGLRSRLFADAGEACFVQAGESGGRSL